MYQFSSKIIKKASYSLIFVEMILKIASINRIYIFQHIYLFQKFAKSRASSVTSLSKELKDAVEAGRLEEVETLLQEGVCHIDARDRVW